MNKLIVVTGGTKGIGRAIVERFAAAGFDIITCSRNQSELDLLKENIEHSHHVKVYIRVADMSVKEEVVSFCSMVIETARAIDVLVNNTGFFLPGAITTEEEGSLERMMHANLYSAYYTTRQLISKMRERRSGHIFNICSIASIQAYSNGGSYAITKFALMGFSKCLREELKKDGIRVTAILPGATLTASWEGVDLPEERFMKSEDVADSVYAAYSLSTRSVVEEIVIRPQLGDI